MTKRKMKTETTGFDLEDALRAGSRRERGAVEVDIAGRLAGNLPSVDRTIQRSFGPRSAFVLAALALTGAFMLMTVLNRGGHVEAPVATGTLPRIDIPVQRAVREDVNVRLATWTTPLESEARALRASLTRRVDSFRERIPDRWRDRFTRDDQSE